MIGVLSESTRQQLEAQLVCPHCRAANLPQTKPEIELSATGVAYCGVCSKTFVPTKEQ